MIFVILFATVSLVVVAAIALFVLIKYNDILGDKSTIAMSATLADLKTAALRHQLADGTSKIHPALQQTTASGLAIVYTITPAGETFDHHLSISRGGQVIAHSAAMTLAAWMAHCLNIPSSKVTVPFDTGDAGIRHIMFSLTRLEQKTFESEQPRVLTAADVDRTAWKHVMDSRAEILANSIPAQIG